MALSMYTKPHDGSIKSKVVASLGEHDIAFLPLASYDGAIDPALAPILRGVPGGDVAGATTCAKALASTGTYPMYAPREQVDAWVKWDDEVLAPRVATCVKMLRGETPFVRAAFDDAATRLDAALAELERYLAPRYEKDDERFMADGENLTLADVFVVCSLYDAFSCAVDAAAKERYPNVCRLLYTVAASPGIQKAIGTPTSVDAVTIPSSGNNDSGAAAESAATAAKPRSSSRSAPAPAATGPPTGTPEEIAAAEAAASAQGLVVKSLKDAKKAGDATVTDYQVKAAVATLLELKKRADALKGVVAAPPKGKGKGGGEKKPPPAKKEKAGNAKAIKETGLGLTASVEDDFGAWYSQVVVAGELIEYYDISGCYILRPWAYSMWECIKDFFDAEIKKTGVENCYFPLFVSAARLEAEKDHIEDFAPEVAWVTRSGQSDLDIPIAVRPTSETVMYPQFANWIRSHRDLPLKLNQWCNVVRWEFKHPTPFIRSREFLWQEGHTAFTNKKDADAEVRHILELYRRVYEELLAVPVIPGVKSEKEKFAGGLYTTTVEAFVPATGRGIQGATSHCLGQNFAKMFDITFENATGGRSMAWQNSWGCTTRTIGVAVMVHGDDIGLVLPPRVAPLQAVVITIPNTKMSKEDTDRMKETGQKMTASLLAAGMRAKLDDRDNYTPGWKYNHWELKGVPLRCEFGPRDLEAGHCVVVRRDNRAKETVKLEDLPTRLPKLCEEMQADMLARATKKRNEAITTCTSWDGFVAALDAKKMVLTPWCETKESEELVKKRSMDDGEGGAAKTLCIPFIQPPLEPGTKCFVTGAPATTWVIWGRSY